MMLCGCSVSATFTDTLQAVLSQSECANPHESSTHQSMSWLLFDCKLAGYNLALNFHEQITFVRRSAKP